MNVYIDGHPYVCPDRIQTELESQLRLSLNWISSNLDGKVLGNNHTGINVGGPLRWRLPVERVEARTDADT